MRMRIDDIQTLIVTMHDEGKTISDIARFLRLPLPFVREAMVVWWQLKGEREWEDEKRKRDGSQL